MPELMCNLCYKDAIEIGKIADGFSLIFWQDKYHILMEPGHNGNIFYTFKNKPTPDPDPECILPNAAPGEDKFDECVEELREFKTSLSNGYELIASCANPLSCINHWTGKPFFEYWIVDRCGKMIAEHERKSN